MKSKNRYIGITLKITLLYSIFIIVVLFGIYIYLNSNLTDYVYNRTESNLAKNIELSKVFLDNKDFNSFSFKDFDNLANEISLALGFRVTIIDISGNVLGDSEVTAKQINELDNHIKRPEIQDALKIGIGKSMRYSDTIEKDLLYIAKVIEKKDKKLIFRYAMPLVEIEVLSSYLRNTIVISLFTALLIILFFTYIISFFISRPIKEISRIANSIAAGDLSKRIRINSNDEIGELARSFNFMTEQILQRIKEAKSSSARLEAVLLSMSEGVMVLDGAGEAILMNKALKELFSIKENLNNKTPLEIVRNIEIQEIVDCILKKGKGFISKETTLLLDEEKYLLVNAVPLKKDDKTEGAVLVFHDITDIRKLERIRRDFVANVSHELRTPISNIKGYAETLLNGAIKDKANAVDFIRIIYNDSERLAKLIEDLLDLSKIESGKQKLDIKQCNILTILNIALSMLDNKAKSKKIKISIDIDKNLPPVLADENKLLQVFLNLIDNAIKYNKQSGSVVITAKDQGEDVRIDIEDTGPGIPEKDMPRLFERFYRVDKARSKELGGTGLGLSIVKHIITSHKGDVSVSSVLGKGTIVSIIIPKT